MLFTNPDAAAIDAKRKILLAELRQLELFLTAGCKQSPAEQITQAKMQERKVHTMARLHEVQAERQEICVWLKDYRRSLYAPHPDGPQRRIYILRKSRLKRALEQIMLLEGNEEAAEIARKALEPPAPKSETGESEATGENLKLADNGVDTK